MKSFTIEEFWKPRLAGVAPIQTGNLVEGWSIQGKGLNTFTEAPLTHSTEEFGNDSDPLSSSVLLVSAPGAVGKSTLAKQIAFESGAVYIDLANAEPVGGYALTGGLVSSGIYEDWKNGATSVLIDGLDEARLKVTQEAFQAFLADVARLSQDRSIPTILFGRTQIVLDAWLMLMEESADDVAVLEIGYFSPEASVTFAEAILDEFSSNRPYATVQREALELVLSGLRQQTANDGDRFAGYAPVLVAVADRVYGEGNPRALISSLESGEHPVTLDTVVSAILQREQGKLKNLPLRDPGLAGRLYAPDEQLDRLVAKQYRVSPPILQGMSPEDQQTYSNALETWVDEHPFLDGVGGASSVVFEAKIVARALRNSEATEKAVTAQLLRGAAANPFLYTFYLGEEDGSVPKEVPEQHIGVIYASLRASLSLADTASLTILGSDEDEEVLLPAEVDIAFSRGGRGHSLNFLTGQLSPVRLGGYVNDINVVMPHSRIELGHGSELELVAPIYIECRELTIRAEKMTVESPPGKDDYTAVSLTASTPCETNLLTIPVTRNNTKLSAWWPGVMSYPWTNYAVEPLPAVDVRTDEALRRLRMFVIECRSHGYGELAKGKNKIENSRMTKGAGQAVLDHMVREGIFRPDGRMYTLNKQLLGSLFGITYSDFFSSNFNENIVGFVQEALTEADC